MTNPNRVEMLPVPDAEIQILFVEPLTAVKGLQKELETRGIEAVPCEVMGELQVSATVAPKVEGALKDLGIPQRTWPPIKSTSKTIDTSSL